jgi:hypothetical protein
MPEVKSVREPLSWCPKYIEEFNAGKWECRNFDARDSKGRIVGAAALRFTLTAEPIAMRPQKERSCLGLPPGFYYCYEPGALRDGKGFGAICRMRYFTTEAEREAAVEKYFGGAQKRAAKVRT